MQDIALREALEERYLAYALSTIMHRALPDARDGLKPVHRRILYGMRLLRLDPGAAFKKSAKIVGDVMGNFHPHGDQAIYDALVRLAQDFASRYPLVDGQGNFGNIDGDNAAAYRYTEARLTEAARLLLDGIDEDAVDFRPSYDGVTQEPAVLPAAFPNLLANGAQGIAVGMATAIPPHNIAELLDAALYLIEQPNARTRTLAQIRAGSGFSDRRPDRRSTGGNRRGVHDRARLVPTARALEDRGHWAWHLSDRRHRNSMAGAENAPGRADRRADQRAQAAAGCRHARRVRRRRPAGVRAALPQRRSGADDGKPVQAQRTGKPRSAQHERTGARPHSARRRPCRSADRMAHAPPRSAAAPLALPARPDRAPARSAGRLSDRLPQPRQGDQDHPYRG